MKVVIPGPVYKLKARQTERHHYLTHGKTANKPTTSQSNGVLLNLR